MSINFNEYCPTETRIAWLNVIAGPLQLEFDRSTAPNTWAITLGEVRYCTDDYSPARGYQFTDALLAAETQIVSAIMSGRVRVLGNMLRPVAAEILPEYGPVPPLWVRYLRFIHETGAVRPAAGWEWDKAPFITGRG